jgi:hypothetical protein
MSTTQVPLRSLGKEGPRIPALGFGLMELSYASYGTTPSEDDQFALLDRALELGATFWDTSEYVSRSPAFCSSIIANEIYLVFTATMRRSWASGSSGRQSATKSFSQPSSALYQAARPMLPTALRPTANRRATLASNVLGLTLSTCVSKLASAICRYAY